jgi:hypothetical protein
MSLYEKMYVITEDEYMRLQNDVIHANPIVTVETPTVETVETPAKLKTKRKCKFCDKQYGDKHDLRRHIKRFHLQQVPIIEKIPKIEAKVEVKVKKIPKVKKIAKVQKKVNKPVPFIVKKWKTLD